MLLRANLIAILLLLTPTYSFTFQNEPDNFRGIKWGTNISELSDMQLHIDHDNSKDYIRIGDKMKIGDATVLDIRYSFYKDRFYSVKAIFPFHSNFVKIRETLFNSYGIRKKATKYLDKYRWIFDKVTVVLKYSRIKRRGYLIYWYEPIMSEIIKNKQTNSGTP